MTGSAAARGAPARARIVGAAVLAHKPGVRTTAALEVAGDGGGRRTLVAKRFADPVRARRLFHALADLRRELDGAPADACVPRPLALGSEGSVVILEAAEGRALDDSAGALARCAGALAELHSCRPSLDRAFDPAHEARKAAGWAEEVGAARPRFRARARRAARVLAAGSRAIALDTDVVVHKDLHRGHVVVGRRTWFLDLDEVRWGDRAFDLAHMSTYAHLLALRGKGAPGRDVEAGLLSSYAARTGWVADERYPLLCLYTCLKIAWQLATGRGLPPRPRGSELDLELDAILAHGEGRAGELT
ncbi:MAG TPA: aminoglycoside phosphotransferase family protein [Actinomycetota bacterium]|nr:aminoglycoside phosphotransferase family protein [Actinomycetota bacterium]